MPGAVVRAVDRVLMIRLEGGRHYSISDDEQCLVVAVNYNYCNDGKVKSYFVVSSRYVGWAPAHRFRMVQC